MKIKRANKYPSQDGYYWCMLNGSPILVEVFILPNEKIEEGRYSPVASQAAWVCHYFQTPRYIGKTLASNWSERIEFEEDDEKCANSLWRRLLNKLSAITGLSQSPIL